MTPLHLRRRIRSALTILRGVSPDEAAEVRAAYRTAYDCGDDEPIADLMRHVLDEVQYQKRARDATDRALAEAVEERDKLRTELADVDEALYAALDINPASLQAATLYAPGGVRRLAAERDEAAALISTVRAQNQGYAAELAEVDQILGRALGYPAMGPEIGGDLTTVCTGEHTPASLASEAASRIMVLEARERGEKAPKRKRTKEDGFPHRVGDQWVVQVLRASGRAMTSREIATEIDSTMVPTYMRWVQDLARAGYLTVAKGPGGVRVYSLKEGA